MIDKIFEKIALIQQEKKELTDLLNTRGEVCDESTSLCEYAEMYAEALDETIVVNPELDPTLSIEGAAAEAKATGDRLSDMESKIDNNVIDIVQLKEDVSDLLYVPITVNSFTNNIQTVEIGQTITDVTLSWTLNKDPESVFVNGEEQPAESNGSLELTGLTLTADTSWTLEATDERGATASKTTKLQFLNSVYYGVGSVINVANLTKILTSTRTRTFTCNAGTGEYIWYLCPARLGTCNFNVGGFDGGFEVYSMDMTNESGYTEKYNVYKSTNAALGATRVSVS